MQKRYTPTTKAYKNNDFLGSSAARNIRILCEYEETMLRLKQYNVRATILFFGSARAKSAAEYEATMQQLQRELETAADRTAIETKIERLQAGQWMCAYYDKIAQLSRRCTEWSMEAGFRLAQSSMVAGVTRYHQAHPRKLQPEMPSYSIIEAGEQTSNPQMLVVCTGGGPGFMEAANGGAAQVPGARNMGMGISLPFEDGLNEHVTPELAFEFHYFFTRKFWMVYHCQALVVAPGGYGTLDELFEVLTLKQTGKVQTDLPVVLFGSEFWNTAVNWESLVSFGVVSKKDFDDLFITDDVDAAFEHLTSRLTANPNFSIQVEADVA